MSLDKTAWISILSLLQREHKKEYISLWSTASNDWTLLYTNSLDALHHLGSRNNIIVRRRHCTQPEIFYLSTEAADSRADSHKLAYSWPTTQVLYST